MSIIGKTLGNAKKHNGQILEDNRHKPIADQMNKPLKHSQCRAVIKIPCIIELKSPKYTMYCMCSKL